MKRSTQRMVVVFCFMVSGCSTDPSLELFITSDAPEDRFDSFLIEVVASTPEGRVCQGVGGVVEVPSAEDLPVYVHLERGNVYTQSVLYRIVASRDGAETSEAYVGWSPWPEEGRREIEVHIHRICFESPTSCDLAESCDASGCEPIEVPEEFNDPARHDHRSCLRDD